MTVRLCESCSEAVQENPRSQLCSSCNKALDDAIEPYLAESRAKGLDARAAAGEISRMLTVATVSGVLSSYFTAKVIAAMLDQKLDF